MPGWQGGERPNKEMARGRRLCGRARQCCSIALLVILVAGAFRQPARHPRTSPKDLRRCSAAQHTRAQASSPVQLLINSSTSSSSVTVKSQGHLHRHAARSDSRQAALLFLSRRGDVWGSSWFCTATPHRRLERARANAGPNLLCQHA